MFSDQLRERAGDSAIVLDELERPLAAGVSAVEDPRAEPIGLNGPVNGSLTLGDRGQRRIVETRVDEVRAAAAHV